MVTRGVGSYSGSIENSLLFLNEGRTDFYDHWIISQCAITLNNWDLFIEINVLKSPFFLQTLTHFAIASNELSSDGQSSWEAFDYAVLKK